MQDFDTESQLAQQRYKQALAAQNQPYQSPEGKMVGNIYVRSNPMEALISGLRMKQAKDELGASRQELKDLSGKRQTALTEALRKNNEYMTGAPAVASKTTATEMPTFDDADAATMGGVQGYGATTGGQAAVAPDPFKAASALIESNIPSLQNAGINQQMELQKQRMANTQQQQHLGILSKVQSPQEALDAGVPMETVSNYFKTKDIGTKKPIVVGNTLVDPDTFKPVYTAPEKVNMNSPVIPDGSGGYKINDLYVAAKSKVSAAGRNQTPAAQVPQVPKGKTLPSGEIDKITGLDELYGAQQRLADTFNDSYGGYGSDVVGGIANTVGAKFSKDLQPQAEWWAAHEANDNVTRNKLFGASLTAGEQAAWDRTTIKPGMSPEMIKNRMAERTKLIQAQRSTRVGNLGKAGYDVGNFGEAPQEFKPDVPKPPAKPSANLTVVRTGTMNGRKVNQMSDGSTVYAD